MPNHEVCHLNEKRKLEERLYFFIHHSVFLVRCSKKLPVGKGSFGVRESGEEVCGGEGEGLNLNDERRTRNVELRSGLYR
jgi:hypothetical protein